MKNEATAPAERRDPPPVYFYTHTSFFEPALSLVEALSRKVEVHMILEITPGSWRSSSFDVGQQSLPEGLQPADPVLRPFFPDAVRERWRSAASFRLAVHQQKRSLHPASFRVSRQVIQDIQRRPGSVLHVDDVDVTPRLALALRTIRRTPVVISVHDPEPHSGEKNWRKTLGRRLAFPVADRFVLYNSLLISSFGQAYPLAVGRTEAVKFGTFEVFTAWSDQPVQERFPTLLFFGRLSKYKGLEDLYAALPRVAESVPNLRVVIAGRAVDGYDPPTPPALPSPASIELIDRYISNRDLPELFGQASLVVCPYRDATQSGVLMTAYAFGKPVVATDIGGLSEYVLPNRTGVLVRPNEPAELADALIGILTDETVRQRLALGAGAARQGAFGWEGAADRLAALYRDLSATAR